MTIKKLHILDVAVIGGGPAGISACLELSKLSRLNIALFESEGELGGIPRTAHVYFGLRDRKWLYTGPAYARKLNNLIRKTSVSIHTNATVIRVIPGSEGELHRIEVVSPEGFNSYECRFIILATGCYETTRETRQIPGTRPAGIFTTGSLNVMANLQKLKPGKHALVIGSEHVALSAALTLKLRKVSIVGMVEEDAELQTFALPAGGMGFFFNFPIYKNTSVENILGEKRVEGVELATDGNQKVFQIKCDTVIVSGKFRPDSALIYNTSIKQDSSTLGPVVDMDLMTSVPNIFAAGNILRGAEMHDLCALEGKEVAQNILKRLEPARFEVTEFIPLKAEYPIRYVVPQKISPTALKSHLLSWAFPGFEIQVAHTSRDQVLEAWSDDNKIWKKSFSKLIANTRIPLPVKKFDWHRVNQKKGITLKLNPANY